MNKEEQIKRLAQNLYNKGFTKSMDFAIQTAAKMLGFPESMLHNKLAEAEANKYGGSSLLNGGAYYGQENTSKIPQSAPERPEYQTQHEEVANASPLDMRKRIAQSIAEESVYAKVPGARRLVERQQDQSNTFQQPEQQFTQQNNSQFEAQSQQPRYNEFETVEKPSLSIDYSEPAKFEEPAPQELSSGENIFDSSFKNNDQFIETREEETVTSVQANEFQEEEQTSLMTGFRNQVNPVQLEPIFNQQSPSISLSQEPASSRIEDSDEDFFTQVLQQPQAREEISQQPEQDELFVQQTVPRAQVPLQAQPQAPAQSQAISNEPEVSIDLTQMFNIRNPNMKK